MKSAGEMKVHHLFMKAIKEKIVFSNIKTSAKLLLGEDTTLDYQQVIFTAFFFLWTFAGVSISWFFHAICMRMETNWFWPIISRCGIEERLGLPFIAGKSQRVQPCHYRVEQIHTTPVYPIYNIQHEKNIVGNGQWTNYVRQGYPHYLSRISPQFNETL